MRLVLAGLLVGLLCPELANPCATARDGNGHVVLTGEVVAIVWDPSSQTEHFVRRASFDADTKDFGFIVPVPSLPEIAQVETGGFDVLETMAPYFRGSGANKSKRAGAGGADEVVVLQSQRVGDYVATVIEGTQASGVTDWLMKNGYSARKSLIPWIDHYVKKKWKFAAFKFVGNPGKHETASIRLSFKSPFPYYPYKAPQDDWPKDMVKPMTVFFLSDKVYRAKYLGTTLDWEGSLDWKGRVHDVDREALSILFKIPDATFPRSAVLSTFHNYKNSMPYDKDLEFYPVDETFRQLPAVPKSPNIKPVKGGPQAAGTVGG